MPVFGSSGIQGARMHRSNVACLPFYSRWTPPAVPPLELERKVDVRRVNDIVTAALDVSTTRYVSSARPSMLTQEPELSTGWSTQRSDRSGQTYQGSPFSLTPRKNRGISLSQSLAKPIGL
ncbi:unnamed protein product [Effrenium voratum]|uniref:Uncharacterized protein n=1 Tax=Effrenium voratum TaxID=2562239 RepID=A0AA36I565_9DINO|nr:unnamed protein product [Effrenium voratum]